ncbi:ribonuclease H-like domain-containing protein [Tanacetum coccineum]
MDMVQLKQLQVHQQNNTFSVAFNNPRYLGAAPALLPFRNFHILSALKHYDVAHGPKLEHGYRDNNCTIDLTPRVFSVKDFLNHRLFLSQKKYALQLLERAHMVNWGLQSSYHITRPDFVPMQFDRFISICMIQRSRILPLSNVGCPSTRRSTSGYYVFLGDNLLSWSTKRQHTISRSSAEAKYRGVANVVVETAWIRNLLRELHSPLLTATLVYCDNVSEVYMSANPVQHQRTKHIEIDIHFVHDMVKAGHVRILHVPSRFQYADIFTKGLPSALFEDFRSSLRFVITPAQYAWRGVLVHISLDISVIKSRLSVSSPKASYNIVILSIYIFKNTEIITIILSIFILPSSAIVYRNLALDTTLLGYIAPAHTSVQTSVRYIAPAHTSRTNKEYKQGLRKVTAKYKSTQDITWYPRLG